MNDARTAGTDFDAQNAEILIERARSLVPALRQRSKQATAERRLPKETIDDFQRLGLTRCLQPAMFGGFASDYRVFSKMLRALAQGCGSSAWVAAVHGEHNWVVGNFSEQAQRDVLGQKSPRRCIGKLRAERIGRTGGRRSSAQRPLGLRQRLRPCAMGSARLHGENRRRAGIADVPIAHPPGRDHRRLARDGTVRHRQQVDRGQGCHRARDAFGQPA